MGNPLPVRGITGHLVWGADGAVWACFEVEPFAYPHRSVRDAREVHARTTAALLELPTHSLILSIARNLSQEELEQRIRGEDAAPRWAGTARRTASRLASESVSRTPLVSRRPTSRHERRAPDGGSAPGGGIGSSALHSGRPHRWSGVVEWRWRWDRRILWRISCRQHLLLRPLDADQVRWLYERAVLRGLLDPPLPSDNGADRPSVVRLDRDAVYFEGGRRTDLDRPSHWRYLTVEHPDHGTGHQAFSCLAETPAAWTFPYGSGEWLWHLDDQIPFPLDWALRIERVDNQAARRRALRAKRNLVGQLAEPGGDPAGPATTLAAATDAVDEHRARLESNPALPALRATTIVGSRPP